MPFDSTAYHTETKPDLSTPRARLLYLRDVVVPRIPEGELDMSYWDCGTTACLAGWAVRDTALWQSGLRRDFCGTWPVFNSLSGFVALSGFFGLNPNQARHLFHPYGYGLKFSECRVGSVSTAELTAHIDDVLEGRV